MNDKTYDRFCSQDTFDEIWEPWLAKAKQRQKLGSIEVYSKKQIYNIPNIDI